MSELEPSYGTTKIVPEDMDSGFSCGVRALDDYFARHAINNHQAGIGNTYVLRRAAEEPDLPAVLGFYTLCMGSVQSSEIEQMLAEKLPRYPMPVALIGRLAVDQRAQGRRVGERLLIDAFCRIAEAATNVACVGVIVDAKNESAMRFYAKYDFAPWPTEGWPRRMFIPMTTVRAALTDL